MWTSIAMSTSISAIRSIEKIDLTRGASIEDEFNMKVRVVSLESPKSKRRTIFQKNIAGAGVYFEGIVLRLLFGDSREAALTFRLNSFSMLAPRVRSIFSTDLIADIDVDIDIDVHIDIPFFL